MIIIYSMMDLMISKYEPFRLLSRSHRCGVRDIQVSVKPVGIFFFFLLLCVFLITLNLFCTLKIEWILKLKIMLSLTFISGIEDVDC